MMGNTRPPVKVKYLYVCVYVCSPYYSQTLKVFVRSLETFLFQKRCKQGEGLEI